MPVSPYIFFLIAVCPLLLLFLDGDIAIYQTYFPYTLKYYLFLHTLQKWMLITFYISYILYNIPEHSYYQEY